MLRCVQITKMGWRQGKSRRQPKLGAEQGQGTTGLQWFGGGWRKRSWWRTQTDVMDTARPLPSISLPRGCLTRSEGRKGADTSFPKLQDSLLKGFPRDEGLAGLKHPLPKRASSCSEQDDQVKHGNGKPSGLMAVNYQF